MIWHSEIVTVKNQPSDATLTLEGHYNLDGSNSSTIEILLVDAGFTKTLYTHNPVMGRHEDPSESDIAYKYASRINKIRSKLKTTDYANLAGT